MQVITRRLLNCDDLAHWASHYGFSELVPSNWHVTLVRTEERCQLDGAELAIPAGVQRRVCGMGGFFALRFCSLALKRRHAALRQSGGVRCYRPFRPHVSFAVRDCRSLSAVDPYHGPLLFGPECSDW